MFVCDEWANKVLKATLDAKPGGTAGVYTLVPAKRFLNETL